MLLEEGNDEQLEYVSPIAKAELELIDAIVTSGPSEHARAHPRPDPSATSA